MPNPYTFYGPGETRAEKDPFDADLAQALLDSLSYLYECLADIMVDPDSPETAGTWTNPWIDGNGLAYRWFDTTTGFQRMKTGSVPGSETDGDYLMKG